MRRQAPDVDGQILINDGTARPGEFVPVEIRETRGATTWSAGIVAGT